jgi:hypothetical protein
MGTKNSKKQEPTVVTTASEYKESTILLLGTANHGKSVVFEQLKHLLVEKRGDKDDPVDTKAQILQFAVENLKRLLEVLANKVKQGIPLTSADPIEMLQLSNESQRAQEELMSNKESKATEDNLCNMVETLWNDPAVKRIFLYVTRDMKMEFSEDFEYVMDNFSALIEPGNSLLTREMTLKTLPPTTSRIEFKNGVLTTNDDGKPIKCLRTAGGFRRERKVSFDALKFKLMLQTS